jgi:hypothetical protein
MAPPDNAMVLCVDEKSQIQALERLQPVLPMVFNKPEQVTHQYLRHGTTTLFAALDTATGKVIADCHPRHRAVLPPEAAERPRRAAPAAETTACRGADAEGGGSVMVVAPGRAH